MTAILASIIYRKVFKKTKSIKEFFEELLTDPKDLNNFALWAFGHGFSDKDGNQLLNSWNKLHSKDITFHPCSNIENDSKLMVSLWRQNSK